MLHDKHTMMSKLTMISFPSNLANPKHLASYISFVDYWYERKYSVWNGMRLEHLLGVYLRGELLSVSILGVDMVKF